MYVCCYLGKRNARRSKGVGSPVPDWKKFGQLQAGKGSPRTTWGFPHFDEAEFLARFPFGIITLRDKKLPLEVRMSGWNPFIPTDPDNSSLPVGAIEYHFRNTSSRSLDLVFSYNSKNFMKQSGDGKNAVKALKNGFVLYQEGNEKNLKNKVISRFLPMILKPWSIIAGTVVSGGMG